MGLMDKFADPALFESLSFGEKMTGSFITMLMGLGVTFLILCLLWAFVAIMGKIMGVASKGDKASAKTEAAAAPSVQQVAPVKNDDEVIAAVIAAAVAAYQGSGGTGNLVVRKISRISGETTLWTNAAREDCIASRKF
ncbi:MAG: OadG family protein [Bacillota bacterium]|nr:OadG family protein [Bacillota bacterium]MBR6800032.1 OadG family protein [Bacillota bacterium]MDO5414081.1 OadG family protein [Bacillota bacterium]